MKIIVPQYEFAATAEVFNLAGEPLIEIQPERKPAEDVNTLPMFAPVILSRCPSYSPWGAIQHREQIAPGIWSVSTAGHGGIFIATELRPLAPAWLIADTNYSSGGWFEEDQDWALACAAFPSMFPARGCFFALHEMTRPDDYLKERKARYLATDLARTLRERAALHEEPKREEASATA